MNDHQSEALTETDVAKRLSLSVATLRAWRLKRKGPRFVRFGRAVRYLSADVDRFIESSLVENDAKRTGDTELW
jgi:excisionase family DNA binding protein